MPTKVKQSINISKSKIRKEGGFVVLPIKEYHKLQEASVPTYYLTGKAAKKHDREVAEAMKEYREGKTIAADSLSQALEIYEGTKNRKN